LCAGRSRGQRASRMSVGREPRFGHVERVRRPHSSLPAIRVLVIAQYAKWSPTSIRAAAVPATVADPIARVAIPLVTCSSRRAETLAPTVSIARDPSGRPRIEHRSSTIRVSRQSGSVCGAEFVQRAIANLHFAAAGAFPCGYRVAAHRIGLWHEARMAPARIWARESFTVAQRPKRESRFPSGLEERRRQQSVRHGHDPGRRMHHLLRSHSMDIRRTSIRDTGQTDHEA